MPADYGHGAAFVLLLACLGLLWFAIALVRIPCRVWYLRLELVTFGCADSYSIAATNADARDLWLQFYDWFVWHFLARSCPRAFAFFCPQRSYWYIKPKNKCWVCLPVDKNPSLVTYVSYDAMNFYPVMSRRRRDHYMAVANRMQKAHDRRVKRHQALLDEEWDTGSASQGSYEHCSDSDDSTEDEADSDIPGLVDLHEIQNNIAEVD